MGELQSHRLSRAFGEPLVGDVCGDAETCRIVSVERGGPVQYSVGAILTAIPIHELRGSVLRALFRDLAQGALDILGMDEVEHGRLKYFLHSEAEFDFPSRIYLLEVAISGDNTGQIGYQVEESFKVTMRLGSQYGCALAFGEVKTDAGHPERETEGIVCGPSRRADPTQPAIGKQDPVFGGNMRRPLLEALFEQRGDARAIFGVQSGGEGFPG